MTYYYYYYDYYYYDHYSDVYSHIYISNNSLCEVFILRRPVIDRIGELRSLGAPNYDSDVLFPNLIVIQDELKT